MSDDINDAIRIISKTLKQVDNGDTDVSELVTKFYINVPLVLAEIERLTAQRNALCGPAVTTTPCPICQWPLPGDPDHHICECCGIQISYNDEATYEWDGKWWSGRGDKPAYVTRLEADHARVLTRLQEVEQELQRLKGQVS